VIRPLAVLLALLACATPAHAEIDWLSPSAFSGLLDLRASAADGERSWLNSGLGKTQVSGDDPRFSIAEADLAWRPQFGFDWSALVEGEFQPDHQHGVGIGEAYVRYKPLPVNGWRPTFRAGLFYPPVSLENAEPFWTPTETITPSAIDSWIGEEVKVVGAEASLSRDLGDQSVGATVGLFGFDDTAGTLMALRGWSFDDVRPTESTRYALPPLSPFIAWNQPPVTYPLLNVDHKLGVYARLDWAPSDRAALDLFYYDNRGDKTGENANDQYAWATHFIEAGLRFDIDDKTHLLAQALAGNTQVSYIAPVVSVNTDFDAAYLLVTRAVGEDSVSGRVDVFSTTDKAPAFYGLTQERGWALTVDYRKVFTAHISGLVEIMHLESNRPERFEVLDESAIQSQTVAQAALRLSF